MTFGIADPSRALATRIIIGLAQGTALYILADIGQSGHNTWLTGWIFASLVMTAALLPPVLLAGIASMRPATLACWALAIIGTCVAVSLHADWREGNPDQVSYGWLVFPLAAAVFIGHHLVAAADADGRPFARYSAYFDISWRNGIQLVLSLAFLGAFWLLLLLGANLFELINISVVRTIIEKAPFIYIASSLVFALAVQISDERISLVTGARTIALLLLSWLLPVMTLFAVTFLASLVFTGLAPLWNTGHATAILVTAGIALITLVNASYQDGGEEHTHVRVLAWSARLASLALAPITAIAFYSVWLRVQQYGLTPERVLGLAVIALGACYASGYVLAALWPGQWMKPLETTNVVSGTIAVVIIIALLTHVADPYRLSVGNQIQRLQAGVVPLDKFDFDFLKFDSGPYGTQALERLAHDNTSPGATRIALKATEAQHRKGHLQPEQPHPDVLTANDIKARIAVFPAGSNLPDSFLSRDWTGAFTSPADCIRSPGPGLSCEALIADIDHDGRPEVLLRYTNYEIVAYREVSPGQWTLMGRYATSDCDAGLKGTFSSGAFRILPPSTSDVEIGGHRYRLAESCGPQAPQPPSKIPR